MTDGTTERAKDLLKDLVGPRFSDTALRVVTDYLKQEARIANATKYVIVPVIPTAQMEQAAFDVIEINVPAKDSRYANGTAARNAIYQAMLAAAPKL